MTAYGGSNRAVGTVSEHNFGSNNIFDAGDAITIINDGEGTSVAPSDCHVVLVLLHTLEVR